MTVVSSKEFAINQNKYFDLAMKEQVFIQRGDNIFLFTHSNEKFKSELIFEPDEDFYQSISMEELRKRVLNDVHQWYKEKNESNSNSSNTAIS